MDMITSRISFIRFQSNGESVEIKVDGDKSWTDLVDDFIYFLKGCGYQVTPEDVRDYLDDQCYSSEDNPLAEWSTMDTVDLSNIHVDWNDINMSAGTISIDPINITGDTGDTGVPNCYKSHL